VNNLGVSTDKYEFVDIYGLDSELLQLVPRPVIAVLLLFPITKEVNFFFVKSIL
jgi:ubiquitin carboxyl-terminal hydrolase L3